MITSSNTNDILTQVKQLDKEGQLTLLQQIVSLLKKEHAVTFSSVQLSSLSGLGSEVWKGTNDIEQYIDEERQW